MNNNVKTNFNNQSESGQSYMPNQYDYNDRGYTDSFYDEYEYVDSGAGSFLFGAIVGGVLGAAAALFLAPKTGKEMREDFSTQASQLKEKGIEIGTVAKDKASEYTTIAKDKATEYSSVAKDKATEYSSVAKDKATEFSAAAKEKTGEVSKSIQAQSGQLVDKVKSIKSKTTIPLDDGTVSAEGEEPTAFVEKAVEQLGDEDEITTTAEAIKEAVTNPETANK
ncbi:YtxH domain-containing protein [Sporosarcina sp. Marseille-Q4063]|uniref:YtxH domain-containing protein n=1 Tax=Sporosarcina sp. Marseille-Q4063 TaxID=2810514 RepID=UPI001BAFF605|nr:YtxH domain-containing protein [Sporosarcina sp. Marseille-Q4063]QUW22739.1 YtxH domain-containing protein [Sporosarcina sp. Marseille-Q4063]